METKQKVREIVFKDDKSDKGMKVQQVLDASSPDPKDKERIWAEITDMESKDTLQTLQNKMCGFFNRDQ